MKRIVFLAVSAFLALGGQAQDLDTMTITDQFDVGTSRGNDFNSGIDSDWGDAQDNVQVGIDALPYSGADVTGGPINYINSWGFGSPESPIVKITDPFNNPDWGTALSAIPANSLSGATDGSQAVIINDDGGFNGLYFGEHDDKDYYIEVDMYCYDKSSYGTGEFEVAGITLRNGRDWDPADFPDEDGTTRTSELYSNEYTYCPDRAFGYSLYYDYQLKEVKAVKTTTSTVTAVVTRDPLAYAEEYGSVSNVSEGWHRLRIEANDNHIVFTLDGTVVADIVDADNPVPFGRPSLYYREGTSTIEMPGIFDNLKAGPATISNVDNWTLY